MTLKKVSYGKKKKGSALKKARKKPSPSPSLLKKKSKAALKSGPGPYRPRNVWYAPWQLWVLAFLHIAEPLIKIQLYAWFKGVTAASVISFMFQYLSGVALINEFLIFPLAGLVIVMGGRWALPLFLFLEVLVIFKNIYYFTHLSDSISLAYTVSFMVVPLALMLLATGFIVRATRLAQIPPRYRWWEGKSRIPCKMKGDLSFHMKGGMKDKSGKLKVHRMKVDIENFSEGGVLLKAQDRLKILPKKVSRSNLVISFKPSFFPYPFHMKGRFAHLREDPASKQTFMGFAFEEVDAEASYFLKVLFYNLEKKAEDKASSELYSVDAHQKTLPEAEASFRSLYVLSRDVYVDNPRGKKKSKVIKRKAPKAKKVASLKGTRKKVVKTKRAA